MLQEINPIVICALNKTSPDGGTGRRAGLKIRFSQESGSSTLPLGTISYARKAYRSAAMAARNWLDTPSELAYISPVYRSILGAVLYRDLVVHHTSSTYKEAAYA